MRMIPPLHPTPSWREEIQLYIFLKNWDTFPQDGRKTLYNSNEHWSVHCGHTYCAEDTFRYTWRPVPQWPPNRTVFWWCQLNGVFRWQVSYGKLKQVQCPGLDSNPWPCLFPVQGLLHLRGAVLLLHYPLVNKNGRSRDPTVTLQTGRFRDVSSAL
jgi:hypothetical protein